MEKPKRICDDCSNMLVGTYKAYPKYNNKDVWKCIFGEELLSYGFHKCTHFKAKPKVKEFGEGKVEKALDKKGQTIEDSSDECLNPTCSKRVMNNKCINGKKHCMSRMLKVTA